jgi:hypothetical protein
VAEKNTPEFKAVFMNEKTGAVFLGTFTLQEYIQTRQWMEYPQTKTLASALVIWLKESNLNCQAAYCAVKVWRDELSNTKGAP